MIANSHQDDAQTGPSSSQQKHMVDCSMSFRGSPLHVSFASPAVVTDVITVPRYHPNDVPELFYSLEEQAVFRCEATSQYSLDWSINGLIEDSIEVARCVGFITRPEEFLETDGCGERIAMPKVWPCRAISASIIIAYCTSLWFSRGDVVSSLIYLKALEENGT